MFDPSLEDELESLKHEIEDLGIVLFELIDKRKRVQKAIAKRDAKRDGWEQATLFSLGEVNHER